jgi:hypothetical protein
LHGTQRQSHEMWRLFHVPPSGVLCPLEGQRDRIESYPLPKTGSCGQVSTGRQMTHSTQEPAFGQTKRRNHNIDPP